MKLVHLVGFITKKFVTMRGHMNVNCLAAQGWLMDSSLIVNVESGAFISIGSVKEFTE